MSKSGQDAMTAIALAASMGWGMPPMLGRRRCTDELEGVDIEAEYELVQQKKSGLSRRLRDEVVYRYKQMQRGR